MRTIYFEVLASGFRKWVDVVLIDLVCVVKGAAKPTAAASERGLGKCGRSVAGDVESPSLLPLLLLLLRRRRRRRRLSLPYDREAISAEPWAVRGARHRCAGLVWVTRVLHQMGYVIVSYLVRLVHKIQVNLSSWKRQRPFRTGVSSERIRLFLPPLGTESKNKDDFLSYIQVDGSDFWASEIAENSRIKGSKFSHNSN